MNSQNTSKFAAFSYPSDGSTNMELVGWYDSETDAMRALPRNERGQHRGQVQAGDGSTADGAVKNYP